MQEMIVDSSKTTPVGDNTVVAAGVVVTKDVAPYTIVGRNPALELNNKK